MPDKPTRILVKAVIWELSGVLCLTLFALFFTNFTLPQAGLAAGVYHTCRILMYFLYEELWMGVRWGKVKRKHGKRKSIH